MKYLPVICFALIPFGLWGQNIFYGHANSLILSALLILFLCKADNDYPLNKWLRAFGVYICLWVAFSYLLSFLDLINLSAWFSALNDSILFFITGLIFFIAVYRGTISFNIWANVICFVATIEAILSIMQWAGYDPVVALLKNFVDLISQVGVDIPTGTLGNQNFLAAFLAISFPFFIRDGKRSLYDLNVPSLWCLALPFIVVSLFISKTTAALGALIIGLAFFYGGIWLAVLSIVPAFIIYAIKYQGMLLTNARFEYWQNAWQSTSSTWQTLLFGWGPGITWQPGNMLHSEYVNTFFNFGLIGLALMICYFISITWKSTNRYLQTAVLIIAVNILGNHAFHLVSTGVLAIVIFALIEREKREVLV
jgi:hypothetical protein